ncbi:ABC transporter permease [Cellulomonas xiejunii]|uniref:ABC transporter permease n=1 Tax=Cellulomonas xiejunii TaxID=2968083 RepID=A0ABY5KU97_9CELL|nr:ABC transporter permease [Cellulomonas xiejunii]MCC2322678.1 ABC transporter permease [Cellulomonas xiejunii]UUI72715.1 ABC transporter permease [Cellulomonas xiejunii]
MNARPPAPTPPSLGRAALLVAEREITSQVRTKSFVISTVILLVGVLAAIVLSSVLAGRQGDDVPVAVVESVAGELPAGDGLALSDVPDRAAAEQAVRDGDVDAAVVPGEGPLGVEVVAMDAAPQALLDALTQRPAVVLLDPAAAEGGVRYAVTFGFGLVFMMSAMGFGATIAQNTVTEKQTRIVEILLSAVPARALLAGKVLGNSALALGQTAAIAAVSVLALVVTGQDDLLTMIGMPVVWFVVFFALGFVLLAAVFAASASLVSRTEDTGVVLQPATWLTMIPYLLVVIFNDNALVLRVMSYVPFSAPVGMPVRLFLGEAAWWEPLLSLGVLAASCAVVIALAARIYERSVLRMGARVKLGEVLRGAGAD